MAAENSAPASRDASLPVKLTESRDDSLTGLPSETEARVSETQEPDTAGSLAAVGGIVTTFDSLRSSFTFASRLDFASPTSSDSPKLAYMPNNTSLHQYEHVLTGLLTQLDAAESYGDKGVRKARKEAVKQIEGELAGLDERKVDEWKKRATPKMEVEAALTENDVRTADIDAAAVPLLNDTDDAEALDAEASTSSTCSLPSTCGFPGSGALALARDPKISHVSLEEASSSDNSDSEVHDYVDIEADVMSDTGTEEVEEVQVEREKDLAELNEWDLDF
ncbi:hypothetical protein FRC09_002953 [Ceratobasidium sp. 395]|nr:hypothetical protein FRC09_002953 [Ceratobasidium sp. 395]